MSSRIDRRRFLLTSLAGAVATPLGAGAQQAGKAPGGRPWRVGILLDSGFRGGPSHEAILKGLRERGYVEGQNLAIDFRPPAASSEPSLEVAAELAGRDRAQAVCGGRRLSGLGRLIGDELPNPGRQLFVVGHRKAILASPPS